MNHSNSLCFVSSYRKQKCNYIFFSDLMSILFYFYSKDKDVIKVI